MDDHLTLVSFLSSKVNLVKLVIFTIIFFFVDLMNQGISGGLALTWTYFILAICTGFVYGIVIGFLVQLITYTKKGLLLVFWPLLFIVQQFNNLLEGYFFTESVGNTELIFGSLLSLLITFIYSISLIILFQVKPTSEIFPENIKSYFAKHSSFSWIMRIILGGVAYFPVYFIFGALVSPFILQYYNTGGNLVVPDLLTIFLLQIIKGFLYTLAFLLLFGSLNFDKKRWFAAIVSILYVPGVFVPFLIRESFVPALRFFHGFELLADCVVYGIILVVLFVSGRAPEREE